MIKVWTYSRQDVFVSTMILKIMVVMWIGTIFVQGSSEDLAQTFRTFKNYSIIFQMNVQYTVNDQAKLVYV